MIRASAVGATSGAKDAVPSLLPIGLGARSGEFVPLYVDTFRQIAVQGRKIEDVLTAQGAKLADLYRATNAACPPPDPEERPCRVE